MKRLFCVRGSDGKVNKKLGFFEKKKKAKEVRNKEVGKTIALGPDHRRYKK